MLREYVPEPPTELDRQVFGALVPPDHYLRRVQAVIDFDRLRPALLDGYSAGHGRPAVEPLLLLRLEFLQFHYGLSDRQVLARAQTDVAFRFFLGLGLGAGLPDVSALSHFRGRLGPDAHQRVFQALLGQAREHGLVGDRLRLKDATHLIADLAQASALRLVAQARQRLLDALRPYAPQRVAAEEARAEQVRLATAEADEPQRLLARVTHLRELLAWADDWRRLPPQAEDAAVAEAFALAWKVLHDREDPDAPDQLRGLADPDARRGKHGDYFTGYLLDVAVDADSELITAVNVLPGNGDEAADAAVLIRQEEQAHGNDVAAVSMDGAGFRGDVLRELTDPGRLSLEVIVPPPPQAATGLFAPEDFVLSEGGACLGCPGGQQTRRRERNAHDTGWKFRFRREQCGGCPRRAECLGGRPAGAARTVIKNDYEAEYRAARAKAQTEGYARARRQHPRVERRLADLVRWHGGRRARYRGLRRVLVQGVLTALVANVKRMVCLLAGGGQGSRGTVRAEAGADA
jgi:transposase